jgi:hypothetical protein
MFSILTAENISLNRFGFLTSVERGHSGLLTATTVESYSLATFAKALTIGRREKIGQSTARNTNMILGNAFISSTYHDSHKIPAAGGSIVTEAGTSDESDWILLFGMIYGKRNQTGSFAIPAYAII